MVLAWTVLIPRGVLVARFGKVTPRQNFPQQLDNQFWWHTHRALQYSGIALSFVAIGLIWRLNAHLSAHRWHHIFGYALLVIGAVQVLGGHLRGTKGGPSDRARGLPMRGDHFDMTRRRRLFEWWHKRMGYAALALTAAATALGLLLADAPRWMWCAIGLWWCLLITIFVWLQKQGLAIDTYTAIWGKPYARAH